MAKRTDLPGVTSNIQDYGLNVSPRNELRNSSILIIGTSEDGPVNEPIAVENKDSTDFDVTTALMKKIQGKAMIHAQERIKQGKSPFAQKGDYKIKK